MSGESNAPSTNQELKRLEERVDELANLCAQLTEENRMLRQQQDKLLAERGKLIEKAETARSRVETMIMRLKTMEQDS